MLSRTSLLSSLLVAMVGLAGTASAAETTQTFQSTSSVVASCSVSTENNMSFYPYDAAGYNANLATSSNAPVRVDLRCTSGSRTVLSFDEGQNKGGGSTCTAPIRNMASSDGKLLRYKLATSTPALGQWANYDSNQADAACRWGGVNFTGYMETSVYIYGFLPAGQNVSVGEYSDVVTFSLTF